jgi:hypothetical protein
MSDMATGADDMAVLRMFREYRHRVGKAIHDLGGAKYLAAEMGPMGDQIESALAAPDDGLRAAWSAAEAGLPDGWHIYSVIRSMSGHRPAWSVIAHEDADLSNTIAVHDRRGTLEEALAALSEPAAMKWARLDAARPGARNG